MVSSSSPGQSASKTMLSGVNIDNLLLQTECLPILIGIHKFRHLAALSSDGDATHIASFLAKNRKCTDIEVYWSQAVKYLSTAKQTPCKTSSTFECARAIDHFWMVLSELTSGISVEKGEASNIFNQRVYLRVLSSIIPIVVSCFPVTELMLLMKPLVASHLAAEHLSNLAYNLPSIGGHIAEVLLNYMRDSLEPAILWRCSRILLRIASCDVQLARSVRSSLVASREYPLLCLELTMRYIKDTEKFVDDELCSRITSFKTDTNWLLTGLRDSDLLQISSLACNSLKSLLQVQLIPKGSAVMKLWQTNVTRCVRISATCSAVCGGSICNTSTPDCSFSKLESTRLVIGALVDAAERSLDQLSEQSTDVLNEKEAFIEISLRLAIVLLTSSYAVLATIRRRMRGDTSTSSSTLTSWEKGALQVHQSSLATLLLSSLTLQERLISYEERRINGSAVEAARCFNLTFRLAVSHKSNNALRALCVSELRLTRFTDFMSDSVDDISRVINELAAVTYTSSTIDMSDCYAVCREFEALHEPYRISGLEERAGDWISCLSLMLALDLMTHYKPIEDEIEAVRDVRVMDPAPPISDNIGSTHTLMVRVLSRAHWPPHTRLQGCVDRWLSRCIGVSVGVRMTPTASRTVNTDRDIVCLGLPLLQNEAINLNKGLFHHALQCTNVNTARICNDRKGRVIDEKNSSQLEVQGTAVMSDTCVTFLRNCGYEKNTDSSDDAGDEYESSHMMTVGNTNTFIERSTDDQNVTSLKGSSGDWCGVMACYSALHYACVSMTIDESVGREGLSCGVMYNGPYVCDLRSLPIKRSIQYLLLQYHDLSRGVDNTGAADVLYGILSRTVDMVSEVCPEVTMSDRVRCFDYNYLDAMRTAPQRAARETEVMMDTLLSLLRVKKEGVSGGVLSAPHYRMACELISSPTFSNCIGTSLAPSSPLGRIVHQLVHQSTAGNIEAKNESHRSDGVGPWLVWRALHDVCSCPQGFELLTLNTLLDCRQCVSSHRVLTSYEQLVQEPLQLLRFPLSFLSDPFVLQLLTFIMTAALAASKRSVRTALAIKHRAATDALNAAVKYRSTYEASLYLHQETFLDLQDVMAARMTFGAWEEMSGDVACSHTAQLRNILNDFLHGLVDTNPRLCGQLLCHQLTPLSFELLMSCDVSVVVSLMTAHTQCIQVITEALNILPPITAIALDPTNTSSSYIFNASANGAASLSSSAEISPKEVERLLLHSMCLLCIPCRNSEENVEDGKIISDIMQILAEAIPSFLLSATNSLNAHLRREDTKLIEMHSARIVHEILGRHSTYAKRLLGVALNGEKIITGNTSAIHMVAKSWGARGNQKVEDDIAMKARPAVKALKKIIEECSSLLSRTLNNATSTSSASEQRHVQSYTYSHPTTTTTNTSTHTNTYVPVGAVRPPPPLKSFREHNADLMDGTAVRKKIRTDM